MKNGIGYNHEAWYRIYNYGARYWIKLWSTLLDTNMEHGIRYNYGAVIGYKYEAWYRIQLWSTLLDTNMEHNGGYNYVNYILDTTIDLADLCGYNPGQHGI